jgi:hypothetical protein
MKNIHILPTEKPSRLFEFGEEYHLQIKSQENFRSQHIYITSDEQAKEGNWGYIPFQGGNVKLVGKYFADDWKKIILTTDVDLVRGGVQSIDDEFLEWFVNNSSCEEVEVESFCKHGDSCPSKGAYDKQYLCDVGYKIIIPQEKP